MASFAFANTLPVSFPHTYRFRVPQEWVRSVIDPHDPNITIHHVYIPVTEFKREMFPDDINPRSHEEPTGRIPDAIERSLIENPKEFHLLNRGELILAQSCKYDNHTKTLEITIGSPEEGGLADGGTTDRVINRAQNAASRKKSSFTEDQVNDGLSAAYVHLEIISGDVREKLVRLAGARNTSTQVKEFALENLGGGFDWLKSLIEKSALKGRVRYRENDPEDVDIRTVLALLTMFHRNWNDSGKDPLVAYTSKGGILNYYRDPEWLDGYKLLNPVVIDVLQLYDFIHTHFSEQYEIYNREVNNAGSKFGRRREVTYKGGNPFRLPMTGEETKYLIPDGWLYPVLASLRMLLDQPSGKLAKWVSDPFDYFKTHGSELVGIVVEQSQALGYNPQAVGKSRPLWSNLRKTVELERLKIEAGS
ncbi:MAG TPA: AIPR family protein [Acidobacteriaceae bacterium]|jgi:hypothetical protein|nr:AIPR family protein [Acidobacteriaceae bacterium]